MTWILPTFNRPAQCAAVLERLMDCKSLGLVIINGYEHRDEYAKVKLPQDWQMIFLPENIGCIGALNHAFKLYPHSKWYGFIGDDEFLDPSGSSDWDKFLIEAAGDWNISHGYEDWNHGNRVQGYVCIGGELVRAVGYLAWHECFHNFGFDCMWEWLSGPYRIFGGGNSCTIINLPEIRIHHKRAEKKIDDCYRLADSTFEKDRESFWQWRVKEMPSVIDRIRKAKETFH
jgi:hypothetical protein